MRSVLDTQISKTIKILLLLLAALLLGLFYYFIVEINVTTAAEKAQGRLDDLTLRQQLGAIKLSNQKAMEEKLAVIKRSPNPSYVADYDNLKNVMVFLDSVLKDSADYNITFGQTEEPAAGENMVRRSMDITFAAKDYKTARKIFQALENCSYSSILNDISIVPARAESSYSLNREPDAQIESGPVLAGASITFFEAIRK